MVGVAAGPVRGDAAYVLRDGSQVAIQESGDELALVFTSAEAAIEFSDRGSADGSFEVVRFGDRNGGNLRVVRVAGNLADQQAAFLEDPTIVSVERVFSSVHGEPTATTTGTLVAKTEAGLTAADRALVWEMHGVRQVRPVDGLPDVYVLEPSVDDADEVALAVQLSDDPRVLWANPNFRRAKRRTQVDPLDFYIDRQWHLHNTELLGGADDADIDAFEAWEVADGSGVLIGMYDDSCDVDHEDLRGGYIGFGQSPSVPRGAPGFDDPRPQARFDFHGTSVMGLAAGRANTVGGRGVAYGAEFTASRGLGEFLSDVEDATVYVFARRQNVDVHINSWGYVGFPGPPVVQEAIQLAVTSGRNKGDVDGDGVEDRLGMVVLFSSGNENALNDPRFEISALPGVIAVGASNDDDQRSVYSNFGETLSFLAPSDDFGSHAGIFTTDVTDRPGAVPQGTNIAGFSLLSGEFETDDSGKYTDFFGGTSAACPIAAGVAALVLSANPMLSATDVRLVMEHTTDRIRPGEASYDGITSHSLRYGYGRINARNAVEAADLSASNDDRTWPDAPFDVRVTQTQLRWRQNINTDDFLLLESDSPFSFVPADGACYSASQIGCANEALGRLPGGVTVLATGCGLGCASADPVGCDCGVQQCVIFEPAASGTKYLAVYGHNRDGLYSFGVAADSRRNVRGERDLLDVEHRSCQNAPGVGPRVGTTTEPPPPPPAVTITASPLSGDSPLRVRFQGNASSDFPIDDSATKWDFDISDGVAVDSTSRTTTHTYEVGAGLTRTLIARLSMSDNEGRTGSAQVGITVRGPAIQDAVGVSGPVQILASLPGSPGSNVAAGTSPFTVMLTIDARELTAADNVQSISVNWDLGDGNRAAGLSVLHTYINESVAAIRVPVSARVSVTTTGGATSTATASMLLTIRPGTGLPDVGDPVLPGAGARGTGGSATPCGAMGLIPFAGLLSGLWLFRRRRP